MFQTSFPPPSRSYSRLITWGIALVVLFFVFQLLGSGEKLLLQQSNLLKVDWPEKLEFCGEEVPLDDFYVREAWEREFLITLARDYQNILYLKRAPKYFPSIESELNRRELPDDLKYVAVAESALLENARSSAGAEGLWQFIPSTAQRYGLQVDEQIDERRNFEKATPASLDYFEFLFHKFDSWTLAAAAYNAGENGIERRLGEQHVGGYYDLYLNSETSRYLFRILAIKEIMRDPVKYGYELSPESAFTWPEYQLEIVTDSIGDLAQWAREKNTTLRAVKELNPWIVSDWIPEGNWKVKVPK